MTLQEKIQAAENSLAAAVGSLSVEQVIALYTEDACLMPNGQRTLKGKLEIGAFFEQAFQMGIAGAKFKVVEVEGNEQEASEVGSYELYARTPAGDHVTAEKGRYLVLWKNVGGKWLLHRDMFNSDGSGD
ncbi:DUF4440 domain-containing protein [Pseudomonas sp. D(2018)]|uniref:YybH family protein n=1 Tax=Pseudomonadaceae TaxID=135621 RepID=UPI0010F6FD3A|nr:DUF4440 domain-containing protein [Pseudomonas sp. D(2018)]